MSSGPYETVDDTYARACADLLMLDAYNPAEHKNNNEDGESSTVTNGDTGPNMTIGSIDHEQSNTNNNNYNNSSGTGDAWAPLTPAAQDVPPVLRDFQYFPSLPPELRLMVWAFVNAEPRVVTVGPPPAATGSSAATGHRRWPRCRCRSCRRGCTFRFEGTAQPVLSSICFESRAFLLQRGAKMVLWEGDRPGLWWRPDRDTLFFAATVQGWPNMRDLERLFSTLKGREHIPHRVVQCPARDLARSFGAFRRRDGGSRSWAPEKPWSRSRK